ncbi:MAG: cell wall hydrolase [Deltaproteobacteria bacterium]|nr:cell wall hydrolase [Deltaproteobacteria bacterium]
MNELRQRILELDAETVLALNGYFEAAGEYRRLGEVAYIAVMAVAMNRAEHPADWQESVQEVVAAHRQFSWTNWDNVIRDPQYPMALKFAREPMRAWDKAWLASQDAARRVVDAAVLNPVQNATFYFNPHICNPSWAKKLHLVRDIGNHRFFAAPGDQKILWACKRSEGWE